MASKINQLQVVQQNLQNTLMQKQQVEQQLIELDSALTGIKDSPKTYKIVGNIMIATSREDLNKDLQEKKEVAEIRLKTVVGQEESIKKNIEKLQKEVIGELKNE